MPSTSVRHCLAATLIVATTVCCQGGDATKSPTRRVDPAKVKARRANELAKQLGMQGNMARDVGDYDSALYYHRAVLETARVYNLPDRMVATLINIADDYDERSIARPGIGYFPPKRYKPAADDETAMVFYDSAFSVARAQSSEKWEHVALLDKAICCLRDARRLRQAESLLARAVVTGVNVGPPVYIGIAYFNLGMVHGKQRRLDAARADFESTYAVSIRERNFEYRDRAGEILAIFSLCDSVDSPEPRRWLLRVFEAVGRRDFPGD